MQVEILSTMNLSQSHSLMHLYRACRHCALSVMLVMVCGAAGAAIPYNNIKAKPTTGKVKYKRAKNYLFRVKLSDKRGTPYSLDRPEAFLSAKALERRKRQRLPVDSTDLPVNPDYVKQVEDAGVTVVRRSKWNNTLLVRCTHASRMKAVEQLPCVTEVKNVWTSPDSVASASARKRCHTELNSWDVVAEGVYGTAKEPIHMLKGEKLHYRGYTGKGMLIAVFDGGFMNVDMIPCMQRMNIVGTADFVVPASKDIYQEIDHGTKVLSVMGVDEPGSFVGTAPKASYLLLRCEDAQTESWAEEDYWAAAAEYADSVGVDVISCSLGFHSFDDASQNYRYAQLDGQSSFISHTASLLARKGIVAVISAGNEGMGVWKKINVPADAADVLTVGALTPTGVNAAFCSVGPTADGRVKPDVMALGSPVSVITGRGTMIKDVGTSFSTPVVAGLVACLWQALPELSAIDIINLVRQTSDNSDTPDNIYGYGMPDFWKAYQQAKHSITRQQ